MAADPATSTHQPCNRTRRASSTADVHAPSRMMRMMHQAPGPGRVARVGTRGELKLYSARRVRRTGGESCESCVEQERLRVGMLAGPQKIDRQGLRVG